MSPYQSKISLYRNVFAGKTNYIPLLVWPQCGDMPTVDELWSDLPAVLSRVPVAIEAKAQTGSDWIPVYGAGTYQCIAIPSLYGCEVVKLAGSDPICKPKFNSIDEILDIGIPEMKGQVIERLFDDLTVLKEFVGKYGWELSYPVTVSPLDVAQLILGEEFMVLLMTEQAKVKRLLSNLTLAAIDLIKLVKAQMGQKPDEYITGKGIYQPGIRMACDSIVNYSPSVIKEFVLPVFEMFCEEFGPMNVHYCTEPAESGHVLPVFLNQKSVIAVDNHQGPDVFWPGDMPLQSEKRMVIITTLELDTREKIDAFLARKPVQACLKNGTNGLIAATYVQSVEQGKAIFSYWQEQMSRFTDVGNH